MKRKVVLVTGKDEVQVRQVGDVLALAGITFRQRTKTADAVSVEKVDQGQLAKIFRAYRGLVAGACATRFTDCLETAALAIDDAGADGQVIVVGDGPEAAQIVEEARSHNLRAITVSAPALLATPRREIHRAFSRLDVAYEKADLFKAIDKAISIREAA